MASSFITKNDEFGFWIDDSLFQVTCRILHDAIINIYYDATSRDWINRLMLLLDNNAKGLYHSYMHLDLDELIIDDDRKSQFNELCESAIANLSKSGDLMGLDRLTRWYEDGLIAFRWKTPLKTDYIFNALKKLQNVGNDTIFTKVDDELTEEM